MDERYLYPMPGGNWIISRQVGEQWIVLYQDHPLFEAGDDVEILQALKIPVTNENLDLYFPERKGKGRCPTLELMELCNVLSPTNPLVKNTKQVGV